MATKAIQATGGDYATVALWEAYLEGIGTLAEDELGQVNNEELSTASGTTFQNITPGLFHVILEAQPTDSFRDNANRLTNALRYNASNGAAWTHNSSDPMLTIDIPNMTLRNLQLRKVSNYGRMMLYASAGNTGQVIENCLIEGECSGADMITAQSLTAINSLFLDNGDDSASIGLFGSNGLTAVNCVIARTVGVGSNRIGVSRYNGTTDLVNCAVFGFAVDASGTIGGTNNATDKSSSGLPATNLQTSLVGATEWESVTDGSEDFRLKSTSAKLKDNGTASGSPTPPSTDIVNQSRSGSTDIGVWELQSGGGAVAARERFIGGGFWF